MSVVLERLAEAAGLAAIYDKVQSGERLSSREGLQLFESRELMTVMILLSGLHIGEPCNISNQIHGLIKAIL